MKLSLDRNELMEAIAITASVIATRTPKPALQCILFDVHGDYVVLSATDLELSVRCSITRIEVEKAGSVLLPADKLGQIVRETNDEILKLEAIKGVCHIRGKNSHFQIYERQVEEFPPVPQLEGDVDFEIKGRDLQRLSDWTVFAAARENTRYAINGVLWDKTGDRITLVATDGRRLAKAVHRLESSEGDQSAIVPTKAMQVISRVFGSAEESIGIKMTENQIQLKSSKATVGSSLLEGHFPQYEDVIPSDNDKVVEFDTEELLAAVRKAALLSNEESKGIKLSFTHGLLTLLSRAAEQGEAVIKLPINYDQSDMTIGFNPMFLTDVLRTAESDKITFEFKESNQPGLFRSGSAFLYVVMPVNLS